MDEHITTAAARTNEFLLSFSVGRLDDAFKVTQAHSRGLSGFRLGAFLNQLDFNGE